MLNNMLIIGHSDALFKALQRTSTLLQPESNAITRSGKIGITLDVITIAGTIYSFSDPFILLLFSLIT